MNKQLLNLLNFLPALHPYISYGLEGKGLLVNPALDNRIHREFLDHVNTLISLAKGGRNQSLCLIYEYLSHIKAIVSEASSSLMKVPRTNSRKGKINKAAIVQERMVVRLLEDVMAVEELEHVSKNNYPFEPYNIRDSLKAYVQRKFARHMSPKVKVPGILAELSKVDLANAGGEEMHRYLFILQEIHKIVGAIGQKDGFVNVLDFTDADNYPIISSLVARNLDYEYGLDKMRLSGSARAEEIERRRANPTGFYRELSSKWSPSALGKFYNTIINLLFLHMLAMVKYMLYTMENSKSSTFTTGFSCFKTKADAFAKLLLSGIDKDLRAKLRAPQIYMKKAIFSGYDTEYQGYEVGKVRRLSSQLASVAELQFFVTNRTDYNPCGVNTVSGEEYIKQVIPGKGNDVEGIVNSFNETIDFVWPLMHGKRDKLKQRACTYLNSMPEFKRVNSKDGTTYILPVGNAEGRRIVKKTFVDLSKGEPWTWKMMVNDYLTAAFEGDLEALGTKTFKALAAYVEGNHTVPLPNAVNSNDAPLDYVSVEVNPVQEALESLKALDEEKSLNKIKGKNRKTARNRTAGSRTTTSYKLNKYRVAVRKELTILSHFNAADYSLFDDFEAMKTEFNILQKSFVTLGTNIKANNRWGVKVRDTILLTSAVTARLADLGQMHGFPKEELSEHEKSRMGELLVKDYGKFKRYAMVDAEITLRHGLFILEFMRTNTNINKIPVSLSSLAKHCLLVHWDANEYSGYKIDFEGFGCSSKGLNIYGQPLINNNLFVAALKGGRNESYMYGVDLNTFWYDWDLQGCYTTIMAAAGNPDYYNAQVLDTHSTELFTSDQGQKVLLNSYSVMNVDFVFPENVKFPTLNTSVDAAVNNYPRSGNSYCTGSEYLLALKLGAKLSINNGVIIPFESETSPDGKTRTLINMPFASFIKTVQTNRKSYQKGSAPERMWKDIGNMVYGQTCQGISGRKSFDTKTGVMLPVPGSSLSSPVIASWITGNARAVIGETLNNLNTLGYKVVSATTDGFITNCGGKPEEYTYMENLILANEKTPKNPNGLDTTFLSIFRDSREALGHNPIAYELKTCMKGMTSWTTRGQFGLKHVEGYNPKFSIVAATGIQRRGMKPVDVEGLLLNSLSSSHKSTPFLQASLRGANSIFKKGGHVTMVHGERLFRTTYDNKRQVVTPESLSQNLSFNELYIKSLKTEMKPLSDLFSSLKLKIKNINNSYAFNKLYKLKKELERVAKKLSLIKQTLLEKEGSLQSLKNEIKSLSAKLKSHTKETANGVKYLDFTSSGGLMLDTTPFENPSLSRTARFVNGRVKSGIYQSNEHGTQLLPSLKTHNDLFERTLIRKFISCSDRKELTMNNPYFSDFVLGLFQFAKGTRRKTPRLESFIKKTVKYIATLTTSRWLAITLLDAYDHFDSWNLANRIFPEFLLDKKHFFRNPDAEIFS